MLKSIFGAGGKNPFNPTLAVFPSIDHNELAATLQVEERGRARGVENQPAADQSHKDSVELEIVEAVDKLRRLGINAYDQQQKSLAIRIHRPAARRGDLESVIADTETAFQAQVSTLKNELANSRRNVVGRTRALTNFRRVHNRTAPAQASSGWLSFAAVLVVALALESVVNGTFFASGSEQGLFGGMAVAVVISAINVGAATIGAFAGCYALHRSLLKKTFGLLAIVAATVVVLAANLGAGHMRDAMQATGDVEAAGVTALADLLRTPLVLENIRSWFLVALGLAIAIITAMKASHLSDPYPGYAEAEKNAVEARDDYAAAVAEANETLRAESEEAARKLEEQKSNARATIEDAVDALGQTARLRADFDVFLNGCDTAVQVILERYREANTQARTAPRPRHFAEPHRFDVVSRATSTDVTAEALRSEQRTMDDLVVITVQRIRNTAKAAIASFPAIDDLEETDDGGGVARESPRAERIA